MSERSLVSLAVGLCVALLLAGCSSWRGDSSSATLAKLPDVKPPGPSRVDPNIDRDRIEAGYRRALAVAEDPAIRLHILQRLADLEMARSEELQQTSTEVRHFFERPIAMYTELIELQSDESIAIEGLALDELYYKLAKAYALDGHMEQSAAVLDRLAQHHPDSALFAETQFRRAEKAFAESDYASAENHYRSVVDGPTSAYSQNSLYMLGWSRFKQGDYESALAAFTGVLDQLIPVDEPGQVEPALADLSSARRNLVDDTLRVMAMAFGYLDGAPAVVRLQEQQGPRAYQHLLYRQLGERYLEQRRYRDSAESFGHFVAQNPDSDFAPDFSAAMIDVYETGNFPSLILPAKQEYVQRYGFYSSYWGQREGRLEASAMERLHQYLGELARYEHARAQALRAELDPEQPELMQTEMRTAYSLAAGWYEEFILSFPEDPDRAEMTFLLGESLYEAGDLPRALRAYEAVAYEHRDPVRGAEAGYAMILLAGELVAAAQVASAAPEAGDQEQETLLIWQTHKIDHALRFAETYPTDSRVPTVLVDAATELMNQGELASAVQVAERVIALEPPADGWLRLSSWLVVGHSYFDLQEYTAAEQAYWAALQILPAYSERPGAPEAHSLRERIAASIYRRAELALAQDDQAGAVELLLSIAEVTPDTEIAIRAQFDAGHYLMQLEQWPRAEAVLLNFRREHGEHSLAASLPARLSTVYQAQEKWPEAAAELQAMARDSDDPEVRRQAQLLAAELYDRAGWPDQALDQYLRYVNDHPRPLADNLEAQYRLTELYGERGERQRRDRWLQQLIDTHAGAGDERSDRSRWLAAYAATELAQESYAEFARIPLRLPLRESLQRKRAALDLAMRDQERILTYGVAEFTTRASYQIGEIYAQLSRDLMESQRPPDLNALELEQYDILLEEQAYPFEEQAIDIHEANTRRSWDGFYDDWVKRSFDSLAKLLPGRYRKDEVLLEVSREIH